MSVLVESHRADRAGGSTPAFTTYLSIARGRGERDVASEPGNAFFQPVKQCRSLENDGHREPAIDPALVKLARLSSCFSHGIDTPCSLVKSDMFADMLRICRRATIVARARARAPCPRVSFMNSASSLRFMIFLLGAARSSLIRRRRG